MPVIRNNNSDLIIHIHLGNHGYIGTWYLTEPKLEKNTMICVDMYMNFQRMLSMKGDKVWYVHVLLIHVFVFL
jgi:hypothetical protein